MTLEEIYHDIIQIAKKYNVSQVILFGSRAKGTERERSDIDIAVRGVSDIFALQEEIEDIPSLYKVDLVDLDECRNPLLLEDIEKYGREIYKKV